MDAISEVETLQTTQQLTATLIPSSTVNVMSYKEDCCFQCQESGHIAHHCPNVQCFECDEYGHIVMDCPHRYHLQVQLHATTDQNPIVAGTLDQPHTTMTKTGTDTVGLDHNPIPTDTTAKVTMNPTEDVPGHTTGITDDNTGVVDDAHTQALIHIILTITHHIADHLHIGALQLTPETTADHPLDQPTNPPQKPHTMLHHIPEDHKVKCTPKNSRVITDDSKMDFYSSDDHSSDSE